MSRIRIAAIAAALSLLSFSAVAGSDSDAKALARVIEEAMDKAFCMPYSRSKIIMCLVNAPDRLVDAMVQRIVLSAQVADLDLSGWKITMITVNDYVVTREF